MSRYTVQDLINPVFDRLHLIYGVFQANGWVRRAERTEPVAALGLKDHPLIYTILGPLEGYIPADRAGSVTASRIFGIRILWMPLAQANPTQRGEGNTGTTAMLEALPNIYGYFLTHPLLQLREPGHADYAGPLNYLLQDVQLQDSGEAVRPGPGGIDYMATDISLRVIMRAPLIGSA